MKENLKISKLSNYIPENERNYEYEIKKFKDSLEQQYPLCAKCKNTVNNVLHKQALWLAEYKMLFFKQKPFCVITNVSIVINDIILQYIINFIFFRIQNILN